MVVPFGSALERHSRATYRPTVSRGGSTHVDAFTDTTSSFCSTASPNLAAAGPGHQRVFPPRSLRSLRSSPSHTGILAAVLAAAFARFAQRGSGTIVSGPAVRLMPAGGERVSPGTGRRRQWEARAARARVASVIPKTSPMHLRLPPPNGRYEPRVTSLARSGSHRPGSKT